MKNHPLFDLVKELLRTKGIAYQDKGGEQFMLQIVITARVIRNFHARLAK